MSESDTRSTIYASMSQIPFSLVLAINCLSPASEVCQLDNNSPHPVLHSQLPACRVANHGRSSELLRLPNFRVLFVASQPASVTLLPPTRVPQIQHQLKVRSQSHTYLAIISPCHTGGKWSIWGCGHSCSRATIVIVSYMYLSEPINWIEGGHEWIQCLYFTFHTASCSDPEEIEKLGTRS